ncbi:proton-coupled amino acid transporter 4-like [Anopheles albimanus]|uniref:proton-coupled amino acid transporter 4-like n=1 Tax=Anopheles albimanus TaxID=7167 RepID=UPI00163EFC63|nr:proton-coupled amino acid transporter 4-like [Anopheles albimanus]
MIELGERANPQQRPKSDQKLGYGGTMMNFCKGNLGTGCFAMGYAFRNGGLLIGALLTVVIGLICLYCQHIVLQCNELMEKKRTQERANLRYSAAADEDDRKLNLAETVEYCFMYGPVPLRPWATTMRHIVNVFICATQIGFCCVYFIFLGANMKQLGDRYAIGISIECHMAVLLILLASAFAPTMPCGTCRPVR